jgi:hypothetical protein
LWSASQDTEPSCDIILYDCGTLAVVRDVEKKVQVRAVGLIDLVD